MDINSVLDSIIDGSAEYKMPLITLVINKHVTYSYTHNLKVLGFELTKKYYYDSGNKTLYYNEAPNNNVIKFPNPDESGKDDEFNFNLMHVGHTIEMRDKVLQAMNVLDVKYAELVDNIDLKSSLLK